MHRLIVFFVLVTFVAGLSLAQTKEVKKVDAAKSKVEKIAKDKKEKTEGAVKEQKEKATQKVEGVVKEKKEKAEKKVEDVKAEPKGKALGIEKKAEGLKSAAPLTKEASDKIDKAKKEVKK